MLYGPRDTVFVLAGSFSLRYVVDGIGGAIFAFIALVFNTGFGIFEGCLYRLLRVVAQISLTVSTDRSADSRNSIIIFEFLSMVIPTNLRFASGTTLELNCLYSLSIMIESFGRCNVTAKIFILVAFLRPLKK
ncbi:hypothetical protein PMAYCL1PPCAC_20947 [Pristionchus mayeri]|uniref:Uncharacterized protein n=1 Tax=Pristionchus mayeri TaxID=1317129 RepID=A0AAN5CVF5_9BILA|nr:hypothetical protein PMAYCL1PPCAC_20947 [Pristionchus mayeri]